LNALLYAGTADKQVRRLKTVLGEVVGEDRLAVFHQLHDLRRYFCTPHRADGLTITVLAAADQECLRQLSSMRGFIANSSIILVLPDRNPKTIAEGHKLQPRFVAYKDSDFTEIGAVVRKMAQAAEQTGVF
jgi:hypothetical protein